MALIKIISGAQTGADRAGLDAALTLGLEAGGWIPYGRRTDEGPLSIELMRLYKLREHPSSLYPPRTEQNVKDSDGTVLFGDMTSPGTRLTIKLCKMHKKPYCIFEWEWLRKNPSICASDLRNWALSLNISALNVAGNRERTNPGIYAVTFSTIVTAFGERQ